MSPLAASRSQVARRERSRKRQRKRNGEPKFPVSIESNRLRYLEPPDEDDVGCRKV